jgi:hypothetical protein
MSLHRSGQMWRLSLNHLHDSANDLKTIATFGQNGVVTYTQLVSLSRGSEIAQFMLAAIIMLGGINLHWRNLAIFGNIYIQKIIVARDSRATRVTCN